jgi:hypothetical protein
MLLYSRSMRTVSGKEVIGIWLREQDVNRNKVSHPLTGPDFYRRVKFETPVTHGDGVDEAICG